MIKTDNVMKRISKITGIMLLLIAFSACSPRIVGTWEIAQYEEGAPGEKAMSLSNIGTMTFNNDHTGDKDVSYKMMGLDFTDQQPFKWRKDSNTITIDGEEDSEFAKTWIILSNRRKTQEWQATDGRELQRLKLRKK
jgi:hypothetical protein